MRKPANNDLAKYRSSEDITREFRGMGLFLFSVSGIINLLALTGSFYMLQIYDRALTSHSIETLVALSALAVGLYLFQGMFDIVRSQVLVRIGGRLDRKLAPLAHVVSIDMPRFGFSTSEALERGRDVDVVRGFMGTQGPSAFFDLPWVPVYLVFVYLLHPLLGAITVGGACVLATITVITELLSRRHTGATHQAAMKRNTIAESNTRNADVLRAMGFAGRAVERFDVANREHVSLQTRTSDVTGTFAAIARVLRMVLQSAILGLGAFLTIKGELSAGAIIACSVSSSRALAPIDQVIGNWKPFMQARQAYRRLRETVTALAQVKSVMPLPLPRNSLKIEKVTIAAPASGQVLLSEVGITLAAGDALGIVGPSAGGKTTLVRAITGVWPVLRGSIRFDNAELAQWEEFEHGRFIGYLPQEISLLDGTIEENISRFASNPDPAEVVKAAAAAGIDDMIVRLEDGYRTQIGPQGMALSAGQRQRVALARALYGEPFLVVMDEPNSNLDGEGEQALSDAIHGIRKRGGIAIIVAHRPSALVAVDLIAVIQSGRLTAFGPKDQVLPPRTIVSSPEETRPEEAVRKQVVA